MKAFKYDAFLSHNFDGDSKELYLQLQRQGAYVYHDLDADLRDQRVLDKLSQALALSRSVLVHVTSTFRDSAWCRTEYSPALQSGKSVQAHRVLVALDGAGLSAPESLHDCPTFNVGQGLESLSRHLLSSNDIPVEFAEEYQRQANNSYGPALGQCSSGSNYSPELLEVKSCLAPTQAQSSLLSLEHLEAACELAYQYVDSPNSDNRCNALCILLCVAERKSDPVLLEQAITYLRREQNSAVVGEELKTYFWWKPSVDAHRLALGAAMLRASRVPIFDSHCAFVQTLPEVMRIRVAAPMQDVSFPTLGASEHAELVRRRITVMSEKDGNDLELEGLLKTLRDQIVEFSDGGISVRDSVDNPTLALSRYALALKKLAEWSEQTGCRPLKGLGPNILDYVFVPLGMMFSEKALRADAESLFERTCRALQESDLSYMVPVYREMAEILKRGETVRAAEMHVQASADKLNSMRRLEGGLRELSQREDSTSL